MKQFLFLLLLFSSSLVHARLIQIIHTNDLHSYFESYYNGKAGYPKVMTKIKELKSEAMKNGMEVLQVDSGDWGDGTSFFLSGNGADSVRALEMLGVEVAAIGNHDFLMGMDPLLSAIRRSNSRTRFTLANIRTSANMGNTITPYVDIEKNGIPIRIIGLTTKEFYFQYSVAPGKITDPVAVAESLGKKARKDGKELVIALTHIGDKKDKTLARRTSDIDLIIGGHSHTRMNKVKWIKNRRGKKVPIVQAWSHGLGIGTLTLDVSENGRGIKVVDYKIHEVPDSTDEDPAMKNFVEGAKTRRKSNLSFDPDEVIGETDVPMTGYLNGKPSHKKSCWGWHMARAASTAVGATVGVHISSFEGKYFPPGPVTYADIADNWPHVRKFGDQGWEIATVTMTGWKLRLFMFFVSNLVPGVTFSGLGYNQTGLEKSIYRIALPAEAAYAVEKSYPQYAHFLRGLEYTGQYYWPVMREYVKNNSPINCK